MLHSEYAYERYTLKTWRKVLHVSSSWIGLVYIYSGMSHRLFTILLTAATGLFLLLDLFRYLLPGFAAFLHRHLNAFFIERDHGRLNSASWYLVSILLVVFLFGGEGRVERLVAGIPVLLLAWGDTAASVFGKLYGEKKLPFFKGTRVGFFACFFVSTLVCLCFQLFEPSIPGWFWFAPGTGLLTAISEALPVPLDDNLTIVIISGAFLFLVFR